MKFGEFLNIEKNNLIPIDNLTPYVIAGVQNYGKGVLNKRRVTGAELTMKKYQVIKENQLMWCKVDTKNGAFGVTRKEHVGSLASTNMCLANIETEKILPDFLQLLFTLDWFYNFITEKSTGTTNRQYLTPQQILEEIIIPDFTIEEQERFLKKYQAFSNSGIVNELSNQQSYLQLLRQSILQEAVQGKLVPQDANDEPAEQLLHRIKAEKARLIKEGKLKKEKELPPITEEEMPFELPEGWVWCRLGEVVELISGQHIDAYDYNEKGIGVPYLTGPSDFGIIHPVFTRWSEKPKVLVQKNDILITVKGSGVGKINILHENNVAIGRQLMAIRVNYLDRDIVKIFLESLFNTLQQEKSGIAIPGISRGDILEKVFALPPFPEQHRIATKASHLKNVIITLGQQVQQCKEQSQQLLQALLREAFEGRQKEYEENEMLTMAAEE